MKITSTDFLLLRFCQIFGRPLRWTAGLETDWLAGRLAPIAITRPIFICGLARSGSTILLELLAAVEGVATHRYCDFPFLAVPFLWNQYLHRSHLADPSVDQPVERPHRDRITITRSSPEAMEEPLWTAWFPQLHSCSAATHRLTAAQHYPRFEQFHRDHVKKILLIRRGTRYVAKNNYHATRIEYLSRLYPDAEFIVPIRHPLTHIESLVRQHHLFCEYARREPRVPRYLTAAGHFEFGPQRAPVHLSAATGARIVGRWRQGDDHGGYALQWNEIYGFIQQLRETDRRLAEKIRIVRYEDFCRAPQVEFARLLERVGLDGANGSTLQALSNISQSTHATSLDAQRRQAIWTLVSDVAAHFGYTSP